MVPEDPALAARRLGQVVAVLHCPSMTHIMPARAARLVPPAKMAAATVLHAAVG